jgi:hypothetical protein
MRNPSLMVFALAIATRATAQSHVPFDATNGDLRHQTIANEYAQDATYAKWWNEIASCEGLKRPDSAKIAKVRFFVVPVSKFSLDLNVEPLVAASDAKLGEVYVGNTSVWDESTIKHEMLHMELGWSGYEFKQYHPVEFFAACGLKVYADRASP